MMDKLDGYNEGAIEVFQIAEAYSKENMNAAIEPAHVLKALLHKDVGLIAFIEKSMKKSAIFICESGFSLRIKKIC